MSNVDIDIAYCLQRIGRAATGWQTLTVAGSAVAQTPVEQVWEVWEDLESWPEWSPLHRSTAWIGAPGFFAGATFEQELQLGFPVGTKTEPVEVELLEPARRASWSGDKGGVKSCHLWHFAPLPDGGTEINNVEVFAGPSVALIRPFVSRRWRRQFQAAVDGLVGSAQGRTQLAG